MSALAALTPPFLICAVVIIAIVAFLRHEMGRRRPDQDVSGEDNSGQAPSSADEHHDHAGSDSGASPSGRQDG